MNGAEAYLGAFCFRYNLGKSRQRSGKNVSGDEYSGAVRLRTRRAFPWVKAEIVCLDVVLLEVGFHSAYDRRKDAANS